MFVAGTTAGPHVTLEASETTATDANDANAANAANAAVGIAIWFSPSRSFIVLK